MRSAIYGAGSLGIVLGVYLSKAGQDVTLVNHNPEQVRAMREHGARIVGTVEMSARVKACFPEEMEGTYDVIFLLTKQLDNAATARFLKPFLGDTGILCTMQNGLPEVELAEIVGKKQVLGCTVAWGATLEGPGVSRLTSDTDYLSFGLGPIEGAWDARCERVKEILEKMCTVEVVDNLAGMRWSKLLVNAAFSGVGTVIGGTFGDAVRDRVSRRVCLASIQESIRCARAANIHLAKIQGSDIEKLLYYENPVKKMIALGILPLAIRRHAAIEPSMLQDLKKHKPCEIGAINGAVCRWGRKYGVPTPVNDRIVEVIRDMESGKSQPGMEQLKRFSDLAL